MRDTLYYSARVGAAPLSLAALQGQVVTVLRHLRREGYFQQYLGLDCPSGFVPGLLGPRPFEQLELLAGRPGLFTVEDCWRAYDEAELFDVVELHYDHVSRPTGCGRWHDHPACGWHHAVFDRAAGQAVMRRYLDPLLARYGLGAHLGERGQIRLAEDRPRAEVVVIDVRYEATPVMTGPAREFAPPRLARPALLAHHHYQRS